MGLFAANLVAKIWDSQCASRRVSLCSPLEEEALIGGDLVISVVLTLRGILVTPGFSWLACLTLELSSLMTSHLALYSRQGNVHRCLYKDFFCTRILRSKRIDPL